MESSSGANDGPWSLSFNHPLFQEVLYHRETGLLSSFPIATTITSQVRWNCRKVGHRMKGDTRNQTVRILPNAQESFR